jgi:hypothetical protein
MEHSPGSLVIRIVIDPAARARSVRGKDAESLPGIVNLGSVPRSIGIGIWMFFHGHNDNDE